MAARFAGWSRRTCSRRSGRTGGSSSVGNDRVRCDASGPVPREPRIEMVRTKLNDLRHWDGTVTRRRATRMSPRGGERAQRARGGPRPERGRPVAPDDLTGFRAGLGSRPRGDIRAGSVCLEPSGFGVGGRSGPSRPRDSRGRPASKGLRYRCAGTPTGTHSVGRGLDLARTICDTGGGHWRTGGRYMTCSRRPAHGSSGWTRTPRAPRPSRARSWSTPAVPSSVARRA